MLNKRQFRRVNFREAVQFNLSGESSPEGCISHDLSEGGIRINTSEFLPLNTQLMMRFVLDRNEVIEETGKVVWIQRIPHAESYNVGLEFEEGENSYFGKKRIRQYHIESHPIR